MEAVRVKFLIVDLWSEPVGPTSLRPIDVPPNIPDVLNVVVVYGCGKGDSLFDCASSVTSMLEMAPESIVVFQDSSLTKLSIVFRRLT